MMAATMAHDAGGESGIAGDAVCGGGDDASGGGIGGPTTLVDVLKAEALSPRELATAVGVTSAAV